MSRFKVGNYYRISFIVLCNQVLSRFKGIDPFSGDDFFYLLTDLNPFPPIVPIWHRSAKLSILILEGITKKFPMSVATMSR